MRTLGIRGLNVTLPHKQAVIPHLDALDDTAREIGAVNTIDNRDGYLTGYNTDCIGNCARSGDH
jgi:shikimate dehydrogenase